MEVHPNQTELLPSADTQLAANKRLAFDFWREVDRRRGTWTKRALTSPTPTSSTTRPATVAATRSWRRSVRRPPQPVKATIDDLVSIVAERDLVVLAFRRVLPDLEHEGQTYTTTSFDMLRIAGGKIVEHWSSGADD